MDLFDGKYKVRRGTPRCNRSGEGGLLLPNGPSALAAFRIFVVA
jgi:hypothetical protein